MVVIDVIYWHNHSMNTLPRSAGWLSWGLMALAVPAGDSLAGRSVAPTGDSLADRSVAVHSGVAVAAAPRARELGIPFDGTPGPLNAITDVAGVTVGHTTL